MDNRKWIQEGMQDIPVIDTHEHLEPEARRISSRKDIIGLYMTHYASTDVMIAGLSPERMGLLQGDSLSLQEKWTLLKPYWELCRNTTYFRALERASIDLYGIAHVDDDTIGLLNEAFVSANRPGWYRQILKDVCHIGFAVVDALFDEDPGAIVPPDPEFFREAAKYDSFLEIGGGIQASTLMQTYRTPFSTLSAFETLLSETVQRAKQERGIVALKCAIAYARTLQFDSVSRHDAEAVFDRILRGDVLDGRERKPLQDYLMHRLAGLAADLSLPMQIHTGLQEGLGGYLPDARPSHLIPLFRAHPHVRFDVFHFAYPYGFELAAIAKQYPNVWVDLCWTHVISQAHAVRALEELLELLPSNKILGFGGDYIFVEGTYAHLQFARENIAQVLADRIEANRLERADALVLAARLLHGNARTLYGSENI